MTNKPLDGLSVVDYRPDWVEEWLGPAHKFENGEEAINWIRSRPDCVKDLMVKFPPSCVVWSDVPLHSADHQYGIIASYSENGQVSITYPDANVRGFVDPQYLRVIEYWGGITPDLIRQLISH
jgi:hypothetical protein